MTTAELLEKYHPYPFWVMSDRYGGSYSGGDFVCFWNVDYPEEVLGADPTCMQIWDEIHKGKWLPLQFTNPNGRSGVGAAETMDESIWKAAKMAEIQEERA